MRTGVRFLLGSDFLRRHLSAWLRALRADADYAFTLFQTRGHQPFVADRLRGVDAAYFNLVVRANHHHGRLTGRRAGHGLLRNQQRIRVGAFFQTRADEHARQQTVIRVRHDSEPVVSSTVTS